MRRSTVQDETPDPRDPDDVPETPPDEPKPAPVQDPPVEPVEPPYVVGRPASGSRAPVAKVDT